MSSGDADEDIVGGADVVAVALAAAAALPERGYDRGESEENVECGSLDLAVRPIEVVLESPHGPASPPGAATEAWPEFSSPVKHNGGGQLTSPLFWSLALLAGLPVLLSTAWVLIPVGHSWTDTEADPRVVCVAKFPWPAAAWTLCSLMVLRGTTAANVPPILFAALPLVTGGSVGVLLWALHHTNTTYREWYPHALLAGVYITGMVLGGAVYWFHSHCFHRLLCGFMVTYFLGIQLTISGCFGWIFGMAPQAVKVVMCAVYPLLIAPCKALQSKASPSQSPQHQLVLGAVSQQFAAFPYRLIFMAVSSDVVAILVYIVEIAFKIAIYIIPYSSCMAGVQLSALPGTLMGGQLTAHERSRQVSIKFALHQLQDFSQALLLGVLVLVTYQDITGIAPLSDLSTYSRRRLIVIYFVGAALEVLLWPAIQVLALATGHREFRPLAHLSDFLREGGPETAWLLSVAGSTVQLLMLLLISSFPGF